MNWLCSECRRRRRDAQQRVALDEATRTERIRILEALQRSGFDLETRNQIADAIRPK